MRICYFGCYRPNYPRNRVIIKGLKKAGAEVIECHAGSLMPERKFGILSLISLAFRLPIASLRLKNIHDSIGRYDAMIAGYPGGWANYLVIPLARILSGKRNVPLFVDQFISLYESYVHDRKMIKANSILGFICRTMDRVSCRLADIALLDTDEHIALFARRLNIPQERFRKIPVGADDELFQATDPRKRDTAFHVLFYGSMIPLQGVDTIIRAAHLLSEEPVVFTIVGPQNSLGFAQARELARGLNAGNITFHDAVEYEALPYLIAEADICLGIFGTTEKASAVVPNKAFEAIAMGKPLITGDSPAARDIFTSGVNALLCSMGSPDALANSIRALIQDEATRCRMADAGRRLFVENFTTRRIGLEVLKILARNE